MGRRKPVPVSGYALTAVATASLALATRWITVLLAPWLGWPRVGVSLPPTPCSRTRWIPVTSGTPTDSSAIRQLPRRFLYFLAVAGVFGPGQFAPTLLVSRATELTGRPDSAIALYVLFNVCMQRAPAPSER